MFFAATLPNLLLSPIAGTFVDRWDHKEVMVVSDILRAAIVLLIPLAAVTNIVLVYPLIFLVTTISVFFRPARVAILPQIVPERGPAQRQLGAVGRRDDRRRHRLPAGRHLRGASSASAVPLAFWVDSATYLASAVLLGDDRRPGRPRVRRTTDAAEASGFLAELQAGWQFLRHETVLLANTIQGAVGQFSLGIAIALTPSFVQLTFATVGLRLAGGVRLPRDRDRARQPGRRVRHRADRRAASRRVGWSSPATRCGAC